MESSRPNCRAAIKRSIFRLIRESSQIPRMFCKPAAWATGHKGAWSANRRPISCNGLSGVGCWSGGAAGGPEALVDSAVDVIYFGRYILIEHTKRERFSGE